MEEVKAEEPNARELHDAPLPGGLTIQIRFPPNQMAPMEFNMSGQMNVHQLTYAASFLQAHAYLIIQESIKQQIAAQNETMMQRAKLLNLNGRPLR